MMEALDLHLRTAMLVLEANQRRVTFVKHVGLTPATIDAKAANGLRYLRLVETFICIGVMEARLTDTGRDWLTSWRAAHPNFDLGWWPERGTP